MVEASLDPLETETDFHDLLLRYSQHLGADRREEISRKLWERFGETTTVMIVDMSGYSASVRKYGVVHYLSMIRRLQLTVGPIIENYNGTIVKFEADNTDARFNSPGDAIQASIALNLALDSANILTPSELDVHVSCGIDHGNCLIPTQSEMYGNPVVRASKLGEDLGKPGPILVAAEAMDLVPDSLGLKTEMVSVEIGGARIDVHSVVFSRYRGP